MTEAATHERLSGRVRPRHPPAGFFLLAAMVAASGLFPPAARAQEAPRFNRDIRPLLSENCFPCHGPDSAARKADLRLDQRDAALAAGVIVPGNPEESELVSRIFSDRPRRMMPPPSSHKQLSPQAKELLRRWVAAGAEYEPHWSFLPPVRPEPPAVENAAWVRNPIDRFILSRLEEEGLEPAPEADRRALARRLSLDLTGLPPSPEDVEEFARDPSPGAYEAFVDRLLASEHWGEQRGRYWLDAARYADTHGIHFDNYREMWSYRDWVIDAFNRNLPFDQFTVEQLAGDLLEEPSLDQLIATGFNRCNMTTNEGGVIAEEYLVLYTRDRTETASQVWLGLTANCAVCHSHKFDPLSQQEFYSMAAFFNNTTQGAMDGNIKDTPPVVPVPLSEDRERWDELQLETRDVERQLAGRRGSARQPFVDWLLASGKAGFEAHLPGEGLLLHAPLEEGAGRAVRLISGGRSMTIELAVENAWGDGHVAARAFLNAPGAALEMADAGDFERDAPFSAAAWVRLPRNDVSGAIFARQDESSEHRGWDLWFDKGRLAAHLSHKWPGDAIKVAARERLEANRWFHVLLTYDGSGAAAGVRLYVDGKPQETAVEADRLKGSLRAAVPFKVGQRHSGSRLEGLLIQDLRLYERALSAGEALRLARASRAAWLAAKPDARSAAAEEEILGAWLVLEDPLFRELEARKESLAAEIAALRARGTVAHIQRERSEAPIAYVLHRGEYDLRLDRVGPETPEVLPPMPAELPRNRLGFARWLFLPEHPLTARVTANRFWQEVFGAGLVRTAGDFGVSGELPSHPELLDWLAVELRDSGWNVKRFFKLLVTSAAYRQEALATPEKLERDRSNRLLSRGPRFRMDAEMVRDYALAASGLLVRKIGGPSVKPYQPDGVWEAVAMMESNTRNYRRDGGEKLYRRSLYTFWKRAAPPASMEIFNAPSREFCTSGRERTNTPLQALVTLNDVQFFEAARHLAQLALLEGGRSPLASLDRMARRLLLRPLRPEEVEPALEALGDFLDYYRAHPEDAAEVISQGESKADLSLDKAALAAWTLLANQLLNLDEVLIK
jgi:hypothetical protein